MPDAAPASVNDEGSLRRLISGLNHTAFDLAVYASQWRSPAPTPDSLPAAGPALPDGIGYPQGSDKRFHVWDDPPFPSFLAQCQSISPLDYLVVRTDPFRAWN